MALQYQDECRIRENYLRKRETDEILTKVNAKEVNQKCKPSLTEAVSFFRKAYFYITFDLLQQFMREIKEISSKILMLGFDILLFPYKVVRQLVFPNKKREGNILSSLFDFFVGVIKRISHFEHGTFRMSVVLTQKYVRQGLFLIGAILLLLSSLEWSNEVKNTPAKTSGRIEYFQQAVEKDTNVNQPEYVASYSKDIVYSPCNNTICDYEIPNLCKKIYLLTLSLRI